MTWINIKGIWASFDSSYTNVRFLPVTATIIGAAAITGLGGTSDGLVWSAPVNAMECSFQYMITLDANPNISLTVHTNSVSFTDLNRAGFLPTCVRQDVTVTPVVPINNQILDNSSATESLLIISECFY